MCTSSNGGVNTEEKPTLGALFRAADKSFFLGNPLSEDQVKVAHRLARCQTQAMGGHLWCCDTCGALVPMYNSCRNRNCPQCQKMDQYRWVSARLKELLPVPYFHCVFTLPHKLNPLVYANPRALLGALFKAAATTLLKFGADPQWMGAKPGILMVLHTWGQKLNLHYHVHCIVTGGGLSAQKQWVPSYSEKYLFPVRAMSDVFRGLYWQYLERLLEKEKLLIPHECAAYFSNREKLKTSLHAKQWVVYAKEPFAGPTAVLKYLARYTHRTAIANSRILKYANGMVTFRYVDYRKQRQQRLLHLPLQRFLRSFIDHVLPSGFMRIRGYGIWANACKKKDLTWCRYLLGDPVTHQPPMDTDNDEVATIEHFDFRCPHCKEGTLRFIPDAIALIIYPTTYLDSS